MSPRFLLVRENVPCVAEVVNRSLKADCTDFTVIQYFVIGFYSSGYHLCLHLYKNVREDLLLAHKCA